jgi:hypothetical protein
MVELVRHRRPKGPETARLYLNHRATSRLYPFSCFSRVVWFAILAVDGEKTLAVGNLNSMLASRTKTPDPFYGPLFVKPDIQVFPFGL